MARHSKTGVRGLYRDPNSEKWIIDLRWTEPDTRERRRHREALPANVPAVAAKQRMREILGAALAGGFKPDRDAPRKLAAALDEYKKWSDTNRPKGASKRRAACDRLLKALGDVKLDDVNPFQVERFKRDRQNGGAAPATVNRDLEILSHFFGLAASWGWTMDATAQAIRGVPHLTEPPGRVRYLNGDEEARLMGALPLRVRRIVGATLLSGMRQSEVVLLRKEAVDIQGRVITLIRTKSNKPRRVYMNEALAKLVAEAIADSREGVPFVFTNRAGEPYTADGVRCMFRRAVEKAEIENFHFHDLRHTTATRLRQRGVGIDAIADVLGHRSLAMAQRYAHLGQDTLRDAMASLPEPAAPTKVEPAREKVSPIRKRRGSAGPA